MESDRLMSALDLSLNVSYSRYQECCSDQGKLDLHPPAHPLLLPNNPSLRGVKLCRSPHEKGSAGSLSGSSIASSKASSRRI